MKLVRLKFFIRTYRHSNPEHPLFARKGHSNKWSFWEGESDRHYFDTEGEAVRTARYLTKRKEGMFTKFEVVRVEVIHRESVAWPKPDVVAHLAQLAPSVYEPPVKVKGVAQ